MKLTGLHTVQVKVHKKEKKKLCFKQANLGKSVKAQAFLKITSRR